MPATTAPSAIEIPGYTEFELDLMQAIKLYLPPVIDRVAPASLDLENVNALPEKVQGVYLLLENGKPTYVGKTDAKHGFRDRLRRHFLTLSSRRNLDLATISFKAVRIMVFTVMSVETALIEIFTESNPNSWQNTGFGSNDPGHRRETQKPAKFDVDYPINIDLPLQEVTAGEYSAIELLIKLKKLLPFDLRYETDSRGKGKSAKHTVGHADKRNATVKVARDGMSLREILNKALLPSLPDGWVATVFPGRLILYKNSTSYDDQLEQLRKSQS